MDLSKKIKKMYAWQIIFLLVQILVFYWLTVYFS